MSKLVRALAAVAALAFLATVQPAHGADAAKPVTISGNLACAMCILKQKDVKSCTNVVVVKEAGQDVVYALADNEVAKAFTMAACEKTLPVKVTGTVAVAAGKKTITATRVEKT